LEDPLPRHPEKHGLLSADEAADLLGVKKTTLYTYASRGWIRTTGEGRTRRYFLQDLRELKLRADAARGHSAAASGAMRFGPPILDTAVSSIEPDGPRYRGYSALELIDRGYPFESVATLLWTGELPEEPPPFLAESLGVDEQALMQLLPPPSPRYDVEEILPLFVAALRSADPLRHGLPEPAEQARARVTLRRMAAAVALGAADGPARVQRALQAPTLAGALAEALGGPPEAAGPLDRALCLCADHELNPSTFAARVAAGTGADRYAVLLAALSTWSGPRHGGASEPIERLVLEGRGSAGRSAGARALAARFRLGEPVPGFGHRLYDRGDPRGTRLLAEAHALGSSDLRWLVLVEILEQMAELGHPPPNLDVGLVGLCFAAGLPEGAARATFAVGRVAGWLAHAWEQGRSGDLLRPRAEYVGRPPRVTVP
jgi:citrate synthase